MGGLVHSTRRGSTVRRYLVLLVLLAPASAFAQRAPFPIPDPDPEVERKSFQVADGFEVNLFAADPVLAKPIQMNFDPGGRLWVVSSEVYPQILPGQTANDKVLVLEDRDGDGRADRTTVFADGLLIPTGVEPGDGGAYVGNSTELLHLKDTDGDGKSDVRKVVLSGFGTEDTHHIIHTLRWGYEGLLYFNQSIYIHSHIETPHGVRRLGGGGIWEFRPETLELDVFIRGLVNPWGHHFDRWGQSFATDGAGGEGINYALPGAYYFTAPDAVRILPGLNPGSPKDCGLEFLSGRHLPEDWRGQVVTNDFRGNRVCRYVISDDGAGFAARELSEVIKTRHMAFRPIDVKMGPDGALYIADWYNPIIQHGEVDFRDPRRDHTRGRIWRVTAKGRPLVERPHLVGAPVDSLLDALKAPEDWTRQQAKRVLKERGAKEVMPTLAAWVKRIDPKDPDAEHQRLEALWTYQTLDVVEPDLLAALLRSPEARARAAATRVVRHWHARLSDPLGLLAVQVADDYPRVRLEAVRALAHILRPHSVELAMRALDRPVDRFLDYALWLTARQLQPSWLPEVQAGRLDFEGNSRHLVFALQAVGSPAVVKPLVKALLADQIPEPQQEGALTMIAALGEPDDLALVFDLAVADGPATPTRRASLLDALGRATTRRKVKPAADLARLGPLLDAPEEVRRASAARMAGLWQVEAARPKLEQIARAEATSDPLRRDSIDALAQFRGVETREFLDKLSAPDAPAKARPLALAALAGLDPKAAAARAAEWLSGSNPPEQIEGVIARFTERRDGPNALASALTGKTLPTDAAKVAVRAARASGRDQAGLIEALNRAGSLAQSSKPLSPEEKMQVAADVVRLGDPARGEAVFRRKEATCLKCHAISGAGGQVGPSLESVGASAPVDYLIDSLLEPGKTIKENYHSLIVATNDGRVLSGIKVRQSDAELVLRDVEDREIAIPLSAIEEQKPGGSLMPNGLADLLTRGELIDLVRFLSELGKVGSPYATSKARDLRRWQVLDATFEATRTLARANALEGVVRGSPQLSWSPAYSLVSGALPLDALPAIHPGPDIPPIALARGQIEVTTPGAVRLLLSAPEALSVWIDAQRVYPADDGALTRDLSSGVHTLTIAVALDRRKAPLRVTLDDLPDSPARARMVVGK
jgi:putative heme-binding domain-containing protein